MGTRPFGRAGFDVRVPLRPKPRWRRGPRKGPKAKWRAFCGPPENRSRTPNSGIPGGLPQISGKDERMSPPAPNNKGDEIPAPHSDGPVGAAGRGFDGGTLAESLAVVEIDDQLEPGGLIDPGDPGAGWAPI